MNPGVDPGLLKPGGKFGDYTVLKLLGAGGMGAVYLIRGDSSGLGIPPPTIGDVCRGEARHARARITTLEERQFTLASPKTRKLNQGILPIVDRHQRRGIPLSRREVRRRLLRNHASRFGVPHLLVDHRQAVHELLGTYSL